MSVEIVSSNELFIYRDQNGIGMKFSANGSGNTIFSTTLPFDVCDLLSKLIVNPNLVNSLITYHKEE